MIPAQLKELLLQSLEHEKGGVLVYRTALECAINDDLREEWEEYLEQTENHVEVLTSVCKALGLDPGERTPGCQVVQHVGKVSGPSNENGLGGRAIQRPPSWWLANASCWRKPKTIPTGN